MGYCRRGRTAWAQKGEVEAKIRTEVVKIMVSTYCSYVRHCFSCFTGITLVLTMLYEIGVFIFILQMSKETAVKLLAHIAQLVDGKVNI